MFNFQVKKKLTRVPNAKTATTVMIDWTYCLISRETTKLFAVNVDIALENVHANFQVKTTIWSSVVQSILVEM